MVGQSPYCMMLRRVLTSALTGVARKLIWQYRATNLWSLVLDSSFQLCIERLIHRQQLGHEVHSIGVIDVNSEQLSEAVELL